VYLHEAYHATPMHLALQLQHRGQYVSALDWQRTVYDFTAPEDPPSSLRKIYYGLKLEEDYSAEFKREADWLLDALNPHAIATRKNTYTRFTLISIARCLLDFADAEYTRDTAESVPRARTLYMTVLDLLDLPELKQHLGSCDDLIGALTIEVQDETMIAVAKEAEKQIKGSLGAIGDVGELQVAIAEVNKVLKSNGSFKNRIQKTITTAARAGERHIQKQGRPTFAVMVNGRQERRAQSQMLLLADPAIAEAAASVGMSTFQKVQQKAANGQNGAFAGLDNQGQVGQWAQVGARPVAKQVHQYVPQVSFDFCIPPNPLLKALRLRAELNLFKIRNCRNIAGMRRELEPYAAPTDTTSGLPMIGAGGQLVLPGLTRLPPTPYRYQALIERSKQLVQLAGQIETAMLYAFEKRDAEYYSLLKARQDVRLARAGIRLQDLRIKEAEGGVKLAEMQQERAQIQADYYGKLLDEGDSDLEEVNLQLMTGSAAAHAAAAIVSGAAAAAEVGPAAAARLSHMAGATSSVASMLSTMASYYSTLASYERRRQEWEFQQTLALQDVRIGAQEVKIAEDHVRVVGQERMIADMQAEHAEAVVEFLSGKFTNVELYDWMGDVLQGVYSFFLQQATSMALLAANQLAFERQEPPPPFIKDDYWEAPSENTLSDSAGSKGSDRRGLTGSARLLQDIHELDQYAFTTNKRKRQLTMTIPLSAYAPFEFQRFRETGVLRFGTSLEMIARDYPENYLCLIKRVRTSVIALIPPTTGIRATLSTTGTSRVVIGGDVFQKVVQNLGPETIALSSPRDATGLFEFEPQSEFLLPFENIGLETNWEFRMAKAANPFIDYRSFAEVLITIDYTAMASFDYQQQVIQTLKPTLSAQRPFSFRHEFADAWYDLHNPDQTATPMTVRFSTRREDFPPNIEKLKIQHLALYFARAGGKLFEMTVTQFRFTENGTEGPVGGGASSVDGIISTLKGNAGSWMAMIGKNPVGDWELSLLNDVLTRKRFKDEEIEEMLFVITFSGRTPEWPL